MNPTEWYRSFLRSKELSAPSGNPLYFYKINTQEYLTLTDVLKNHTVFTAGWDSCFVLYATEWWRKCYEGSNWSWDPILRSINKSSLSALDRNQLVSCGFKRWRRPVNENLKGNDFIGTVVLECGLPLRVLESEHYLADLIADLYQELGAISSIEAKDIELVKSVAAARRLPQVLQKDAFFHLLLQFVTTLVNLNEEVGFSTTDKPVEKLDKFSPDWKKRFPLRIEEAATDAFIEKLLKGVTKLQKQQPPLIRAIYRLSKQTDVWKLTATLDIKAALYKFPVLGISGVEFETLSNKLEIYVSKVSGDLRIGFAFKNYEMQGFHLDKISYRLSGRNVFDWNLYLLDPISFKKIFITVIAGGLDRNSEPLIFGQAADRDEGGGWEMAAAGSARLKFGNYRILTTADAVLTPNDGRLLGNMAIEDEPMSIYEAGSDISIEQNGSTFFLSFSDQADNYSYDLSPRAESFEFYQEENKAVCRGWPKIYKIRQDGVIAGVIGPALEYYTGGRWAKITPDVIGKVKIRLTDGVKVLFCKTIQVLPSDFGVEFNTKERTVQLLHSREFSVTVYSDVKTMIEAGANGHIIHVLEEGDTQPESFQIGLMPKDGRTDKVVLKVPMPKAQVYFYTTEIARLRYKALLYLHDLYGSRLYVSNLMSVAKICRLRLKLEDQHQSEDIAVYRSLKVPAYGNVNLALASLKELMLSLLSITTNIDAKVLLSCDDKSAIEISQFKYALDRIGDGCIQLRSTDIDIMSAELRAFRLDQPFSAEQVSTLAYERENNCWRLPGTEGAWFIYPSPDCTVQFRPMAYFLSDCLAVEKEINIDAVNRLYEAAHFKKAERVELLDKVLDLMAADFGHPDWMGIYELYQCLLHLPLSSQHIFDRLSVHGSAILTAALVLPEVLILRLSQEFGIIWAQYPVEAWVKVFTLYYDYLNGLNSSYAEQAVKDRLEWLGHHLGLTSIRWMIEHRVLDQAGRAASSQVNSALVGFLIAQQLNGCEYAPGLRGRHPDERWPDKLSDDFIGTYSNLPEDVKALLAAAPVLHQKYVIYLPFILAAASASPDKVRLPTLSPLTKFRIREIISFDEKWFSEVYNYVQGYLLEQ